MKSSSLHGLPVWAICSFLGACELMPPENPEPAEPAPAPATTTEVTVTRTEPEPMPEPPPSEPPPPPPEVARDGVHETDEQTRGRLAPAKISGVLQAHAASFNQCYAKVLPANPGLAGTVTLVIVISPEGTVPHAEVVEERSTLDNLEVQTCLINEAKTLRFDKPVGGRVVTHYPLEFKPAPP